MCVHTLTYAQKHIVFFFIGLTVPFGIEGSQLIFDLMQLAIEMNVLYDLSLCRLKLPTPQTECVRLFSGDRHNALSCLLTLNSLIACSCPHYAVAYWDPWGKNVQTVKFYFMHLCCPNNSTLQYMTKLTSYKPCSYFF